MCAMQLDSIEGVNGKIQMNVTKGAVAKSKGTLVMLSLTKNVQRHDPSKLLRIICSQKQCYYLFIKHLEML